MNGDVASLFLFSTWVYRIAVESSYYQRLRSFLKTAPVIPAGVCVTSALLLFGERVTGRSFSAARTWDGGRRRKSRGGVHTQYNSCVRQAMQYIEKQFVFLE